MSNSEGSNKSYDLPTGITVIGRGIDCNLCIPITSISKKHCHVNHDGQVLKVRDLNSRNGTFVNGELIEERPLKSGDYLKIGTLEFMFQVSANSSNISVG